MNKTTEVQTFYDDHPYPPPVKELDDYRWLWQKQNVNKRGEVWGSFRQLPLLFILQGASPEARSCFKKNSIYNKGHPIMTSLTVWKFNTVDGAEQALSKLESLSKWSAPLARRALASPGRVESSVRCHNTPGRMEGSAWKCQLAA